MLDTKSPGRPSRKFLTSLKKKKRKERAQAGGEFEEHGSLVRDLERDIEEEENRSLSDPPTFEIDLDIDEEEDAASSIRPAEDKKD